MLPESWCDAAACCGRRPQAFPGNQADKACYGTAMITRDVRRRADAAAATFDDADFVHALTRKGLLDRLQPIVVDASLVVDLGTATGSAMRSLASRFRGGRIVGVDASHAMLLRAHRKQGRLARKWLVQADACRLPFADHSVDVVFANMLLPYLDAPLKLFTEVSRVLRRDGVFAFSTLGPDSLQELRHAWPRTGAQAPPSPFLDMHDVGDAVVRSGLRDPVLDVDRLTVTYPDAAAVFRDLTAMGGRNSRYSGSGGLVGGARYAAMLDALERCRKDGVLSFDLELVYGHCWGSGRSAGTGEVRIDPAGIARRRG